MRRESVSGLGIGGNVQSRMATQTVRPLSGGPPSSSQVCELCGRAFGSVRGLGQHRRMTHAAQSNDRINTVRSRSRWSPEELRLMAEMEANATIEGILDLGEYLSAKKPDRSKEAIRLRRRHAEYKAMVASLIASLRNDQQIPGSDMSLDTDTQQVGWLDEMRISVEEVRKIRNQYAKAFQLLGEAALRGEHMDEMAFTNAIKSMFGTTRSPRGPMHCNVVQYHGTAKQRRRQQYARVQKLYKTDTKAAVRIILDNADQSSIKLPTVGDMFQAWGGTFGGGEGMPRDLEWDQSFQKESMKALWDMVTIEEIEGASLASDSAAGPDGISPRAWNRVNNKIKRLIYNLFIWYEKVPSAFKVSRTVFIPKEEGGSTDPSDFRPLTVCSVVLRGFNKILARRLVTLHEFDKRQHAYLPRDGVGACVFELSAVIDEARRRLRELHVAGLDISKAFPSVKHGDIVVSQMRAGCPRGFVNYVRGMYTDVKTEMQFEGHKEVTLMNRGIYQGDPFSGPFFTMDQEDMLKSLNSNVGVDIGCERLNASSYADDANLYGTTRAGVQLNIDRYSRTGKVKGLEINAKKSWTLSLVPSGKEGKMKVETGKPFNVGGVNIKELTVSDLWRYLGVDYKCDGPELLGVTLDDELQKLSKGPLKPQQRVHILKAYVIPRHQHKLVLSRTSAKSLKRLDIVVRQRVRKWLSLPKDVPVAYLHAPVKAGGLGIPCLQLWVPLMRLNRLERAIENGSAIMVALRDCNLFKSIIHSCKQSLAVLQAERPTMLSYGTYWRNQLILKVDGKDLEQAWVHRSSTSWNSNMMSNVSGEDYVHYHQIRANALPTRVRTARGRPNKETSCRGGCRRSETAQHVIQECHRTHGVRVRRHDRIVDILAEELRRKIRVLREQRIVVAGVLRKPDLILLSDDTAHVLDVQVVKCGDLNASHVRKMAKYKDQGLERHLIASYGVGVVKYHACTVSYKGVWCQESVTDLKRLGVREYCLFRIVTSTLRGTWLGWRQFNSVTFMQRSGQ